MNGDAFEGLRGKLKARAEEYKKQMSDGKEETPSMYPEPPQGKGPCYICGRLTDDYMAGPGDRYYIRLHGQCLAVVVYRPNLATGK